MFEPDTRHKTIYTQYKRDSSNFCDIIDRAYEGLKHDFDFDEFYKNFWDIETATGHWLDIWGVIVAVDRYLDVPMEDAFFGMQEGDLLPFNDGIFYDGTETGTSVYKLNDDIFRRVIIAKAMANIVSCDTTSLNQILTFFFEGRGKVYITSNGNMVINYLFEFELVPWERSLFEQNKIFPHPAGVLVNIIYLPDWLWGFKEAEDYRPFNDGIFYKGQ